MARPPVTDLADLLRDTRALDTEVLEEAAGERARTGEPLAVILHRRGLMQDEEVASLLVSHLNLPFVNAAEYGVESRIHHERPGLAREYIAVLDRFGSAVLVSVCDIPRTRTLTDLETQLESKVCLTITSAGAIEQALNGKPRPRESHSLSVRLERARLSGVASTAGAPPVDLSRIEPDPAALRIINQEMALYYHVLPLYVHGGLTIAVENPFDLLKLDDIFTLTNRRLRVAVGYDLERHIRRAYGRL